jgi:hypothetical protein
MKTILVVALTYWNCMVIVRECLPQSSGDSYRIRSGPVHGYARHNTLFFIYFKSLLPKFGVINLF